MWYHKQNYNLNQQFGNGIHDLILMECEKYSSTTILKPVAIMAELIKLYDVNLLKMMPNKKGVLLKCTCEKWPYWKLVATKVSSTSTEQTGSLET